MSEYSFITENLDIRCYKNRILQRSLSTVHTPRIAFQIEMTMGTSLFTQSKTACLSKQPQTIKYLCLKKK